jgi:hypothetical protein
MEAMLGISLYSYLYLNKQKTFCLSYYCLYFLFNKIRKLKIRAEQILPGSKVGVGEEGGDGDKGEKWSKQCMHI